jgi:hypothetical protein
MRRFWYYWSKLASTKSHLLAIVSIFSFAASLLWLFLATKFVDLYSDQIIYFGIVPMLVLLGISAITGAVFFYKLLRKLGMI